MPEPTVQDVGASRPRQRLHYLDNAKGLASLLGIFYHASLVYSCGWWGVCSPPEYRIPLLGYCALFLTYFRMPLFMFVAGYFTAYGLRKYGSGGFLYHRTRRIGLPFLTALVLLQPFQQFMKSYFSHPENWGAVILTKLNPFSSSFSFSHLWFLYFLIIYSLLIAAAWQLAKPLSGIRWPARLRAVFFDLHKKPWGVVACWLLINLVCVAVFYCVDRALPSHHPAWLPLTSLGKLLPIFLFGFFSQTHPARINGWLNTRANTFLMMFCVLIAFHYLKYEYQLIGHEIPYKAEMLYSILCKWVGTIAVLGLIRQCLNYQNPLMRYMSDASYPVYLFHQPLIILIGFFLVTRMPSLNPYVGYLTLCLLAIILTYGVNELLIRRSKTGRFLFTGAGR